MYLLYKYYPVQYYYGCKFELLESRMWFNQFIGEPAYAYVPNSYPEPLWLFGAQPLVERRAVIAC
jgi:hypothetical protein